MRLAVSFSVFIAACASRDGWYIQEGYQVTKIGVAKFLRLYKKTGSISRKPGTGRASNITASICDIIKKQMDKDGEITMKEHNTYRDRNDVPSSIPGLWAHAHAHASSPLNELSHSSFRRRS